MNNDNIKFAHIYVRIKRLQNRQLTTPLTRATFAWRVEGNTTRISVAVCSPRDQFSKRRGRLISSGRIKYHGITVDKPLNRHTDVLGYLAAHQDIYTTLNEALIGIDAWGEMSTGLPC